MKIESSAWNHQTQYSAQQRKLLGVHYTPDNLIDYIVSHTLFSYLDKNKFTPLDKIKILDPACGSGLFLLKAFDLLCSLWQKQFGQLKPQDIRHILENNLYGVDIENNAVPYLGYLHIFHQLVFYMVQYKQHSKVLVQLL